MKPYKLDNKKRRILKKLYLGEFAMLGFEISCETTITDFDSYDAFVDDFIDYIDSLGLCFGGGGLEHFEGFLCAQKRYIDATEEQKAQVIAWLKARGEVKAVESSELLDANYF
ncbi:50S ribosome-binding protein YggL [Vibrio sp. MarTm2]|uniref:YggL 50S ribosome-binding family protein n=1 Tax=Vibrio sp. MarTm2 TaxID=2998831 RepID=UPI0022CDB304|nr:50S ribosome-binding protein YggL [Vibrio sp. MarTm2]MDA0127839.1 50S ribosome-binding protein YggL [Vibrio sp. MarTm2]